MMLLTRICKKKQKCTCCTLSTCFVVIKTRLHCHYSTLQFLLGLGQAFGFGFYEIPYSIEIFEMLKLKLIAIYA